jgi:hypothetical protein
MISADQYPIARAAMLLGQVIPDDLRLAAALLDREARKTESYIHKRKDELRAPGKLKQRAERHHQSAVVMRTIANILDGAEAEGGVA